ncbi:hypothetical protein ACWN8P_12685 [Vagococcus salmoninarum]|uniref:hypothetical protein n=1 Tax=Vagococcus salmoninarum TaxID=2739 RepID=UPI001FD47156|nr:hypothetical protein [Vagococcus salmoninarum]
MKKKLLVAILLSFCLVTSACSDKSNSRDKKKDDKTRNTFTIEKDSKGEFITLAEKHIKELYQIDNLKLNTNPDILKVYGSPDEVNSETGEVYKNVINGITEFTYQDKVYKLTFLYSKTDDEHYKVLYLYSNYDTSKIIDVPLND